MMGAVLDLLLRAISCTPSLTSVLDMCRVMDRSRLPPATAIHRQRRAINHLSSSLAKPTAAVLYQHTQHSMHVVLATRVIFLRPQHGYQRLPMNRFGCPHLFQDDLRLDATPCFGGGANCRATSILLPATGSMGGKQFNNELHAFGTCPANLVHRCNATTL